MSKEKDSDEGIQKAVRRWEERISQREDRPEPSEVPGGAPGQGTPDEVALHNRGGSAEEAALLHAADGAVRQEEEQAIERQYRIALVFDDYNGEQHIEDNPKAVAMGLALSAMTANDREDSSIKYRLKPHPQAGVAVAGGIRNIQQRQQAMALPGMPGGPSLKGNN